MNSQITFAIKTEDVIAWADETTLLPTDHLETIKEYKDLASDPMFVPVQNNSLEEWNSEVDGRYLRPVPNMFEMGESSSEGFEVLVHEEIPDWLAKEFSESRNSNSEHD